MSRQSELELAPLATPDVVPSQSLAARLYDEAWTGLSQAGLSAENSLQSTAAQAMDLVRANPVAAMGYAAGAILGGTAAVICSPIELTVGGAIVAGGLGIAAVDGAAYLLQRELES